MWLIKIKIVPMQCKINSWHDWFLWIRVHDSEIQNNESNMAERSNKNKQILH